MDKPIDLNKDVIKRVFQNLLPWNHEKSLLVFEHTREADEGIDMSDFLIGLTYNKIDNDKIGVNPLQKYISIPHKDGKTYIAFKLLRSVDMISRALSYGTVFDSNTCQLHPDVDVLSTKNRFKPVLIKKHDICYLIAPLDERKL